MKKYFTKKSVGIFIISLFSLLWFQNCGQVEVSTIQSSVNSVAIVKDQPVFELCPVAGSTISVPVTYMFIVDMSLSNLGGFTQQSCEGGYRYSLALDRATDHELINGRSVAKRLKGITDFVNQIADSNPNLRYSIIGFGTDKILGGPNVRCDTSATDSKSEFLTRVNFLQNVQNSDYTKSGASCSYNSPFTMGTTSYMSAINCVSENIDAELLISSANRPFYQIFFITDGKPNERTLGGELNMNSICGVQTNPPSSSVTNCQNAITACNSVGTNAQVEACIYDYITQNSYVPKVQSLVNTLRAQGFGFNLKPIFYEKAGTPPEQSDFPQASRSLNRLAQADGSQTVTSPLTDLNSLVTELRDALGPQATVNYSFTSPLIVNLNAKPKLNSLDLDSDEDGVSDKIEDSLVAKGFDKNNARSTGILDGICLMFFNGDNCAPTNLATCSQTQLGYKMNKCDQDKLKVLLPNKSLTGFDSDLDGVIDYIEIIRSTNPFNSDYSLDDDEDGIYNLTEIANGSDHQSDQVMPNINSTQILIDELLRPTNTQCVFPGTTLKVKIENVSLIEEKPINTVLVSIIAEPIGSTSAKRRLYVARLNLNSQGKFNKITLGNQDIELVGEF